MIPCIFDTKYKIIVKIKRSEAKSTLDSFREAVGIKKSNISVAYPLAGNCRIGEYES